LNRKLQRTNKKRLLFTYRDRKYIKYLAISINKNRISNNKKAKRYIKQLDLSPILKNEEKTNN
jgi:hypothetical protein